MPLTVRPIPCLLCTDARKGYDPGLGVGIAFLILFAILTFVHLWTTLKSKRIWLLVVPSASVGAETGD